jgi:hypothetical protein
MSAFGTRLSEVVRGLLVSLVIVFLDHFNKIHKFLKIRQIKYCQGISMDTIFSYLYALKITLSLIWMAEV